MLAKINSAALYGVDALRVEVEIDLASGLPQLATVGLPEGAAAGCKVEVIGTSVGGCGRGAISGAGYWFRALEDEGALSCCTWSGSTSARLKETKAKVVKTRTEANEILRKKSFIDLP